VAMPAIDKGFTLIHGDFIQTGTVQADYIRVGSDADTRVSEGEEANQIVQENKNVWDQAAINAQNALSNISDMSSDSKITPVEKINLKREFDIATQEKTNAALIATSIKDNAGNEIPAIATAKNNLITSYNNLNTYVSPLLADMNATSNVDSTILTQKFTDFYEKLDLVYKAIDEYLNVARNFADNVSTTNYTEINGGTIKTGTITADKIVVEGRNFIIKDLQITPTKNKIEWTTFTLQELAEDTTYTVGSASSTYTSTVTYYLIVRINKNDPNNMNSQNILYTSSTLDKGQIGDFTYYPLGTVKFITNEIPIVSIDKGFTKIHGDYIQTGTIEADKITSNFTISAGQYIQAGDANRNYKLDGTQGLIRGIYGTNYNIPAVVKHGILNFDGTYSTMIFDISDLHLSNYDVLLNIVNGFTDTGATNKYCHLSWEKSKSNENQIYINWSYFDFLGWEATVDAPYKTTFLPSERGVWSDWQTLGQISASIVKITLEYYKMSALANTRTAVYFSPGASFFTPAIRHRKGAGTNTIETEINWYVEDEEIISLTTYPVDPTLYDKINAKISHFGYYNMFYPIGNLEYTIIGY
jgi:hypothetical protein